MHLNREILHIAIPAILTNIALPLLGLFDVAIAGHLGDASMIGAIAVGAMMFNLIYWNFGFLRMGTSGMTAQAYGATDGAAMVQVLERACAVALAVAAAVLVLQVPLRWLLLWLIGPSAEVTTLAEHYFNVVVWGAPATLLLMAVKGWFLGMQDARSPMIISIGINVVNIVISLVAVLALGMGFTGIAVGTVTAEWLGLLYALWRLARRHRTLLKAHFSWRGCVRLEGSRRFFTVNVHIFIRSFCLMLVTLFFMAVGARSGDVILAVNALIMQLFTLYSQFMDGFAFAGEALVGKYYGARNLDRMRRVVRRLFVWAVAVTAVFMVAYAASPRLIFSLLTTDTTVVDAALTFTAWCVAIPLCGMAAFVWDGVFIGLTRTRQMLEAVAIASAAFFALNYLLPDTMGNHRLWLSFVTYLSLRGIVLTLKYTTLQNH